ncbi:bacteriocin immunity protein [Stratiformator vulcanicus]|uniref:Colicin-E2 immunity protein n=1 Tax=Stratiformator vulcanicus TaxID=2527980 RepID=A0A517R381_9PLAN|nr:bacteriocin immunity protein [Stratiformator vulcanicus]QDT38346.1 Colicin-E2 immunity protein [Stratiformator vulcanicus]
MSRKLDRRQLIELVTRLMRSYGTEDDIDVMIDQFEQNVPHPEPSDLIFYPQREMSAEEIVDMAINYKPIVLD